MFRALASMLLALFTLLVLLLSLAPVLFVSLLMLVLYLTYRVALKLKVLELKAMIHP